MSAFHLNSPGQVDMHMLVIMLFMTAANEQNFARASGFCGPPKQPNHTVPVNTVNSKVRIQCVEGYVRKAGTSNLFQCTEQSWVNDPPLKCIPDPKKPHVTKKTTQMPHFTSSTTERTEIKNPTVLATSIPTTGYITLTTTNVVTTKTRRTPSQPTLKSTTKAAESITTTNEITSSTSSSFTSRDYVTTTSSHSSSSSFTSVTGVNVSMENSTAPKEKHQVEANSSHYTSTLGGVTSIVIILLAATLFFIWWKLRHRERSDRNGMQLYTYVHSAEPNTEASKPLSVSVSDTNQPQTGPNDADTCDKLLPQTDSG